MAVHIAADAEPRARLVTRSGETAQSCVGQRLAPAGDSPRLQRGGRARVGDPARPVSVAARRVVRDAQHARGDARRPQDAH